MSVALLCAAVAAAGNVLGALTVVWRATWNRAALESMLAVAAGFMVSVAIVELIPESIARSGVSAGSWILGGYLVVHLTQHTFAGHFHFGEERHRVSPSVSTAALAGLMVHTFVDGVAIASGYEVSTALGTLVFGAILLHKVPEGLAIASMFVAAGAGRRAALVAAAALGVATILGVALTGWIDPLARYGLPLAAGVSLYVGASNLVPELHRLPRWRTAAAFFGGCGLFLLARAVVFQ
ncbi:MAG: Zinc transporter ZupT [Gemmatimonadaceae bacterium]|nr:Zinc transporter ZupT [Gemmatimonadaceae bacterium]